MNTNLSFLVLSALLVPAWFSEAAPLESPVPELNIHLVGVHPEKDHPEHQSVAHHFCQQVDPDFAQCVLYDGSTKTANLMGIEYIISEKTFEGLPENEKQYWHPHNYEILSGALSAPGLDAGIEKSALKEKMNSYGKTWHVWRTPKCCNGTRLPFGKPTLQWSLNHDGEAFQATLQKVKATGVDVDQKRKEREDLASVAKPQTGVNALKRFFPAGTTKDLIGVSEKITTNEAKKVTTTID
jgi:Protein of unknown function (DUF1264)